MAIILSSINDFSDQPMTDQEQELVHYLRVMLGDLPHDVFRSLNTLVEEQRGERWSDEKLIVFLHQAISDINSEPPHTAFTLNDFPQHLRACVLNGSMIFALVSESVLQVGEAFSYSDNGISLSINLAQGYQSMAQMLLTGYVQMKKDIKRAMRPQPLGIKSSPAPVRIRSYSPRQWQYR